MCAATIAGIWLWSGCDAYAEVFDTSDSGGAGGTSGTSSGPSAIAECAGHIYACGDLVDNDADGVVDAQDSECLGPCDNTEDSYFGGIPGQAGPPCDLDCYFDQDSGVGNDDCFWNHKCDPHEAPPDYYPEPDNGAQCAYDENASIGGTTATCGELALAQSQTCLDTCMPLTPNGCDCFGCCELPMGSGSYVWLGSEGAAGDTVCAIGVVNDPELCHPCEPVQGCFNGCSRCELCLGKSEVPADCSSGEEPQCPAELQGCGVSGQQPCPSGYYCITGCCIALPE